MTDVFLKYGLVEAIAATVIIIKISDSLAMPNKEIFIGSVISDKQKIK